MKTIHWKRSFTKNDLGEIVKSESMGFPFDRDGTRMIAHCWSLIDSNDWYISVWKQTELLLCRCQANCSVESAEGIATSFIDDYLSRP